KQIASLPLQVQGTSSRSSSVLHNRQPKHYIYFNDAIDPQAAAPSFVYQNANGVQVAASVRRATKSDSTAKYYRPLTWAQRNQVATTGKEIHHPEAGNTPIPTAVVVSPISPLPIGNKWYLYIKKGLANTSKNASLSTQRHIWIGNIAPFKVQNIYARLDVNQPRQINVVFNSYIPKKLTQEQFAQWISVTPMPKHARYQALGKTVIIKGNFDDTDTWNVRVKPDITSTSGLTLTESFDKKITFESLPTGLALPSYNTGQYAKGHRLYEIDTVNLASVRIRVKQISSDGIARAAQGYRHYSGNGHNYNAISPEHPVPYTLLSGKTIYDRTVFLDNKIDTSRSITIDWNEVLGNRQGTGTLFVSVEGEAKNKSNGDRRVAQSLVQLTDIGLCWKLTSKQALIYAFSCNTGKPLANVQLEVFNEDAQLATTVQTDANGLAKVPRTEQSRHLLAKHGNDRYIVPFDRTLSTVSLWRFPVQIDWNHLSGWKRNAMMFTDRNLYRPGETVQLKGIVRRFQDNQVELPADGTAQLIIRDSASRVLVDEEVTLSKNGTFDHTLDLPAETVGSFEVELTLPEDPAHEEADSWVRENYRIFHHRFHVQEFRRNAFEITSNILPTQPGDPAVKLNLSAGYYQGQPVKDAKVQWYFTAKQTGFYPKKYRDFLFGDHREYDPWYWSHYFGYSEDTPHRSGKDREGEAKLDRNGKGELSFDLPKQTFPSTLQVNLHSEVTDSRNQTLTSRTRATVHPADTYIGISRVDRLVRVGEDSKLELIAVDSKGEKLTSSAEVKVLIEREYYEAVKVKHTNGRVRVKNTKKTAKISESTITIEPDKPTTLPFIPTESGRHVITLSGKDAKGHAFATASKIWIYGSKEYPWAVEDGSKIKIVPEKKRYLPGDTARLLVMTPIEGTALVTVERAGVHREYRRELKADNPVIELPLTDMDAPNAFVSIIVIRGASASPRKHKEPALKLGYCTLNVANVKDRLDVALKVETSQNRPGESTTISGIVRTADGKPAAGSEVVLYAEDEGTLAVAGYKNPKPMGHFHAPRPLLVRSGTSFSTFIAENPDDRMFANKGFAIGGGDGSDGGNLRPKPRSDFNPCAVWQPAIKTDENGAFQVEFINPDTLTRYRVVAVALHGASKFGSANTHYTVNKPLMLEPTPPRYASEGDQLLPKVLVQNNSEFEGSWKIGLKTSGVSEITSGTPTFKTISLKPGDQAAVTFDVQFTNTGTAHWTWSAEPISIKGENSLNASMKRDLGDLAENTFEVTYPVPKLRQVEFISMRKDNQRDFLRNLDPELLGGRGHLDLDLSNSLLLEAGGAVDFLLHYPYGCVEQTTSSLMPWFAVRDLKKIVPGFRKKKEADISSAIQQGADRLLTMQTKDGGLAYWPGGRDPEIWASAYGG
ncbi:MAG: alpha-2-macroglobulin family protein, partial [Akkermansiaceae bacterium]